MLTRTAVLVVAALLGLLLSAAPVSAAPLPGLTMEISYSGNRSATLTLPVGADFEYLVNYTCATEACVDYGITIPFPAGVNVGNPSYGGEITGVTRTGNTATGTTLQFQMASSVAPGTSGQFTVPASTPGFTTADNSVFPVTATMASGVGGAPSVTSATTLTVRADVDPRAEAQFVHGGVIGDVSRFRGLACLDAVHPSTTWGVLGTEAGSTLTLSLPEGSELVDGAGGAFAAGSGGSPDTVTFTLGSLTSLGCATYDVRVRFPASDSSNVAGATKTLDLRWQVAELGKSPVVLTASAAAVLTGAEAQPSVPELLTANISTPRSYGSVPHGKAAIDDNVGLGTSVTNTGTSTWTSAVLELPVPVAVRPRTITANNGGAEPADLELRTSCGPDRSHGTGDDGEWELAATIPSGASASFNPASAWPSSSPGVPTDCHVIELRITIGSFWPGSTSYPLGIDGIVQASGHDGSSTDPGDLIETIPSLDVETLGGSTSVTRTAQAMVDMAQSTLVPRFSDAGTLAPGVTGADMAFMFTNLGARLVQPVVTLLVPEHVRIDSWTQSGAGWTPPEPTVTKIEDWSGSTSTLWRFTFPDGTVMPRDADYSVNMRVELDDFAYGNLRIAGRADSGVTSVLCNWDFFDAGVDTDDMDGDGNTTEQRCRWDGGIAPNPAASASVTTRIKGAWDSAFVAGPATGYSTPGSEDTYQVTVRNNGRIELSGVQLVDKLPRPGDTNILTSAQRNPTSGTFPVVLSDRPVLPDLATAPTMYWSSEPDACQPELDHSPSGCVPPAWSDWSTDPPDDLAEVALVRVDFGSNILKPGYAYTVELPVTTPTDGVSEPEFAVANPDPLNEPNEGATNSAAFRARRVDNSSLLNAAEPPGVRLEMPGTAGPIGPPPVASPLSTTGVGTAAHTASVTPPTGGSVHLVDGTSAVTSLTVPGVGTYTVDPTTGALRFDPELGYHGTAPAVTLRLTDVHGQTDEADWDAEVELPVAPVGAALASTGPVTEAQQAEIEVPAGGSLRLLDGSTPVTTLTVPAVGTYRIVGATIVFEPVLLYFGSPPSVDYRLTDAYGQSADGTYSAEVTLVPLIASPRSSTGVATAPQDVAAVLGDDESITLLDGTSEVTTLTVPNEGTYELDPTTGQITFLPTLGFHGPATPVTFRLTNRYGQTATSTYSPVVAPPAPPTAPALTSASTRQAPSAPQSVTFSVPAGGSVHLLAGADRVTSLTVPGEGTYVLDPATGVVVFTPAVGFAGPVTPVPVVVVDAYGQTATGSYTPVIAPVESVATGPEAGTGTSPGSGAPGAPGSPSGSGSTADAAATAGSAPAALAFTGSSTAVLLFVGMAVLLLGLFIVVGRRGAPAGNAAERR